MILAASVRRGEGKGEAACFIRDDCTVEPLIVDILKSGQPPYNGQTVHPLSIYCQPPKKGQPLNNGQNAASPTCPLFGDSTTFEFAEINQHFPSKCSLHSVKASYLVLQVPRAFFSSLVCSETRVGGK